MSWFNKLLDPLNGSTSKTVLRYKDGGDNIMCINRGFDSLDSTTEIYSVKCIYLYLKFIFYHVIVYESYDDPKLTESFRGTTSMCTVLPSI